MLISYFCSFYLQTPERACLLLTLLRATALKLDFSDSAWSFLYPRFSLTKKSYAAIYKSFRLKTLEIAWHAVFLLLFICRPNASACLLITHVSFKLQLWSLIFRIQREVSSLLSLLLPKNHYQLVINHSNLLQTRLPCCCFDTECRCGCGRKPRCCCFLRSAPWSSQIAVVAILRCRRCFCRRSM